MAQKLKLCASKTLKLDKTDKIDNGHELIKVNPKIVVDNDWQWQRWQWLSFHDKAILMQLAISANQY